MVVFCLTLSHEAWCHRLSVGPEAYYSKRTRAGGSKQDGWLYGVKARYDRIYDCALYWGANWYYAEGNFSGNTGGYKLKSRVSDTQIEGRVGYTLSFCHTLRPRVALFVGYGYFQGKNKFCKPSPLSLKFRNTFQYGALGFMARVCPCPEISLGLNFKSKSSFDGTSKITNDPKRDSLTLDIGDAFHYEVEVPIEYSLCYGNHMLAVSLEPFFRYRHYGGRSNFFKKEQISIPFHDTKFRIWGARCLLSYKF